MKILLVEDDLNIANSLKNFLTKEAWQIDLVQNVAQLKNRDVGAYHLILLDWMLPDGTGLELLKDWRAKEINVPVIFLTARADVFDKVLGLELGANDYLTKPFDPRELMARIHVQVRTRASFLFKNQDFLEHSGIRMNLKSRQVSLDDESIHLVNLEFELLKVFLQNPGQVFSRDELLNMVWGYESYPSTRTVDFHVAQLRQKLRPDLIETLRGVGYRLIKR